MRKIFTCPLTPVPLSLTQGWAHAPSGGKDGSHCSHSFLCYCGGGQVPAAYPGWYTTNLWRHRWVATTSLVWNVGMSRFRHRQLSISIHEGYGARQAWGLWGRIQHKRSSTEASNWMPESFTLIIIEVSVAQVPLLWVATTRVCPDFIRAFPIFCIGWPVPQVHRAEWICGTWTSTITVQTRRSWHPSDIPCKQCA